MDESLRCITTTYFADSTEFCPIEGFQDLFVCGNYQLLEESRTKVGKLYLYNVATQLTGVEMSELHQQDTQAILDLKWSFQATQGSALLGQVTVDGALTVYSLSSRDALPATFSNIVSDSPGLSLDWSNRISSQTNDIVVSCGSGSIVLCRLSPSGIEVVDSWTGHEYEAWIAAFDYHDISVVYSGADDCMFKGWDTRQGTHAPMFTKRYDMGVTTIQCDPHSQHRIAVGSYDETVKIWDTRTLRNPLLQHKMGGGVWRVKWHPYTESLLLAACTRAGFRVIKFNETFTSATELDSFRVKCDTLAYGADWCYNTSLTKEKPIVATCSFYDRTLALWQPKIN